MCLAGSRKLPDLGTFQVGDSMLGRLYFSLQWYFCWCWSVGITGAALAH